jgi:predicted metal-binding protein
MKVFPIPPDISKKAKLDEFQKELCQLAIKNGAENASIINVSNISYKQNKLDCPQHEKSFYYPQIMYKKDPIQQILKKFQWALVFSLNQQKDLKRVYEVTAMIESYCFYHNFHLAVGLAAGNCRPVFCSSRRECQSMTIGKGCAFPMMARPSIEACHIDLEKLADQANFSNYHPNNHYLGMIFVD